MTRAQFNVLHAVQEWFVCHDYAPSLEELAQALGMKSASNVHQHVKALIALGKLRHGDTDKRNIELPDQRPLEKGTVVGRAVTRMVGAIRAYEDSDSDGPSIADPALRAVIEAARELAKRVDPDFRTRGTR